MLSLEAERVCELLCDRVQMKDVQMTFYIVLNDCGIFLSVEKSVSSLSIASCILR